MFWQTVRRKEGSIWYTLLPRLDFGCDRMTKLHGSAEELCGNFRNSVKYLKFKIFLILKAVISDS